ncbi:polyketide cyclase / dehydrase and lipid transport [Bacillus haikouensis]|uniref:SRPBCC family protein n=1 Tax=Bacillus haikouensis TaxID=1510468 RepID=UPI00155740B3|nr:SRPBCC family protein [Bacillus haikouensis]NQD64618.1 polyketide cyclase / dehydrase and lipid transport [Bacillus haikouensis]
MSVHFEVVRHIGVSKERAYEGLLDLDAARHWMQGLVKMERLDDGPLREGSEWKETRKMFGKEAFEHFEVVELDEPNRIVLRCDGTKGTTGKGEFIFTYILTSAGEQTEVTLNGEIRGMTGIAKLFTKMMAGMFKKACTKDLDALKMHLESRVH